MTGLVYPPQAQPLPTRDETEDSSKATFFCLWSAVGIVHEQQQHSRVQWEVECEPVGDTSWESL